MNLWLLNSVKIDIFLVPADGADVLATQQQTQNEAFLSYRRNIVIHPCIVNENTVRTMLVWLWVRWQPAKTFIHDKNYKARSNETTNTVMRSTQ